MSEGKKIICLSISCFLHPMMVCTNYVNNFHSNFKHNAKNVSLVIAKKYIQNANIINNDNNNNKLLLIKKHLSRNKDESIFSKFLKK